LYCAGGNEFHVLNSWSVVLELKNLTFLLAITSTYWPHNVDVKRTLGDLRHRWRNNTKMDLISTRFKNFTKADAKGRVSQGQVFISVLRFSPSISFHRCSTLTPTSSEGWTKRPLEAQSHRDMVCAHRNEYEDICVHGCSRRVVW
jgi:hypothetical protein